MPRKTSLRPCCGREIEHQTFEEGTEMSALRLTIPILLAALQLSFGCGGGDDDNSGSSGSVSEDDRTAQVTTDGQGTWVAVWTSLGSLGGTIGTDRDILVARSTDDGVTWTAPAALNTNAATDSGHDLVAQLTTDGLGNWVAVWASDDSLGDTIGTDWDILVARSTDDGATWTAPAALNTNAASDSGDDFAWIAFGPQVTTDGQGSWVAVWHSDDSLGGTLSAYRDIFFSRSSDAGATWTAPAALNSNAAMDSGNDNSPQVTTDGAGNWVAAWDSYFSLGPDADIVVSRSTDAGATWTAAAALNTNAAMDSGNDSRLEVTTDGAGNWVAVWESQDWLGDTIGTDADIFVSRSTDAGATWTAPVPLNTNAATDSEAADTRPLVTTDSVGNWVAVWVSNNSLGDTIGTDWDILVARSTDDGATWTAPVALNTNAATDSGFDIMAQVTTDGLGTWITVWQSPDSLGDTIGTDTDILLSRSTDDGATWTAPVALNTNAASDVGD
jgi:predicted neuraminidase